jgi:hypothetical protein
MDEDCMIRMMGLHIYQDYDLFIMITYVLNWLNIIPALESIQVDFPELLLSKVLQDSVTCTYIHYRDKSSTIPWHVRPVLARMFCDNPQIACVHCVMWSSKDPSCRNLCLECTAFPRYWTKRHRYNWPDPSVGGWVSIPVVYRVWKKTFVWIGE